MGKTKKNTLSIKYLLLLTGLVMFIYSNAISQVNNSKIHIGAYYFDGWTGTYPYHITTKLKDSFPERMPKWGWITSKQKIVDEQIVLANKVGISFFSFCWYYSNNNFSKEPLNNALRLFKKSKVKSKVKYCLLIANHNGQEISKTNWDNLVDEWIKNFKHEKYLTYNNKPLIIFFSLNSLINQFGDSESVKIAINTLRRKSSDVGIKGVSIAICVGPEAKQIDLATRCGFDVLTGYNYHDLGIYKAQVRAVPIDTMINREYFYWEKFKNLTNMKYIPVSTLNWDPRPWASGLNNYETAPYLDGFSSKSVYYSVKNGINWLNNQTSDNGEKILMLYAWNEYGEGAYLTPTAKGNNLLIGVRKAINNK